MEAPGANPERERENTNSTQTGLLMMEMKPMTCYEAILLTTILKKKKDLLSPVCDYQVEKVYDVYVPLRK